MTKNIIELEAERLEWSLRIFPEATKYSSLEKLKSEIAEVIEALKHADEVHDVYDANIDQTLLREEYADCLMCLFDSAGRAGITPKEIFTSFEYKLEKNKNRIWKKNPDNTYSHVKQ